VPTTLAVLVHAAATLAMTGLIWFVQIVHYPLFARVGPDGFAAYAHQHTRRTGYVVGPLMLMEAATALLLLVLLRDQPLVWTGLALLALIWGSTFLVQVPHHRRLATGFDRVIHPRLVLTNWVRTVAWTLRAGIALAILFELMQG